MDAALYHCLREEIQQDTARIERRLEELRKAESFLLRRIKTARSLASYQVVLNDLETEITQAEELLAELMHLSRFVTRALISAYATEPAEQAEPVKLAGGSVPVTPSESSLSLDEANNHKPHRDRKHVETSRPPLNSKRLEFDAEGFPLDPPSEASMNTILEPPKPLPAGNPLSKKEK